MDTKQPEALRIANTALQVRNKDTPDDVYVALGDCAWALRNLHAENEQLRAGYDAARLEIESLRERVQQLGQLARDVNSRRVTELEAQLAAVGAGGVEPLRKRCLHQISEPAQAQPVDLEPVAAQSRFLTEKGWGTCTLEHHLYVKANPAEWPGYETRALYAAPQPAAARVATDSDDALMAREMYESQDDSLLLCASDLQHSAIYDNHIEMQSCIRAVADRITALASVIAAVAPALATPAQAAREPLTDSQIADIYFEALGSQHLREQDRKMVMRFARAVEAEVQKQDEALVAFFMGKL